MSADVVSLAQARIDREPHLSGKARCLACKHEWIAVAPIGALWLECPSCSLERGRYIGQVAKDGPHWHCDCGNDLFQMTPTCIYCPNCGVEQNGL